MGTKLYVNQPIDIRITVTVDGQPMTTATEAVITVMKPDKSTGTQWVADIDNDLGIVSYSASAEDIDQPGKWKLQPVITLAGIPAKVLPGSTVEMDILKRFI